MMSEPVVPTGRLIVPDEALEGAAGARLKDAEGDSREREKRMSPPGALGLPKLLDQRRLEYGIMDSAFTRQAMYDRILMFQVTKKGRMFGDTNIFMPDQSLYAELDRSEQAIVISAGLEAMDVLRTNGMDLGHIVTIGRNMPMRYCYDWLNGKPQYIIMGIVGDIVASTDTASMLRTRELRMVTKAGEKMDHRYVNENGEAWAPASPYQDPALVSA